MGSKGRVDGSILPAVNALLGCRHISDVLAKGIPTLNNLIAMILPHKQFLFASKFDLVVQRMASHKGLDLDHLLRVPLAYIGEIEEATIPKSTLRKVKNLAAACELF